MNIREKYNIKETSSSFSFEPAKPRKKISQWFFYGTVVIAIALPLFARILNQVWYHSLFVLSAYGILHSLYDIYVRAGIRYTFDRQNNSIYRMVPFFSNKKIMKLNEAVIFVSSEMGSWHYSLGAKKSQFIKSYFISENFSSGKKSDEKQAQYENHILAVIYNMIDSVQSV